MTNTYITELLTVAQVRVSKALVFEVFETAINPNGHLWDLHKSD